MNHSKILAIGAVFIMIAAAFAGVCFGSNESDATATKVTDSNNHYTQLEGTNSEIPTGTYNVAVGCTIKITFQIAPAQFSLSVSDDSYGITAGYDSSIGYRYISGTVVKTGTFTVTGTARDGSSGTYTFNAYDAASSSTTSSVLGFENFISKAADWGMTFSYTYDSYGFVNSFSGDLECDSWTDIGFETQTVYCTTDISTNLRINAYDEDGESYDTEVTGGLYFSSNVGEIGACDRDGNPILFFRFVAVNTDEFHTGQLLEDEEEYDSLADASIEGMVGYTIVVPTNKRVTIGGASSVCGIGYNVTPDGSTFSVGLDSSSLSFYATEAGKIAYVEIGTDADNVTGVVMIKSEEAEETPTYYTHTITYSTDGGSSVSNTVVTDTNSGSSSVTLATAPTKSGYTFKGWKIGNTTYAAGDKVSVAANSSVTATAQWTAITYTHTITYSTDGGSSVSNTVVTDTNSGSSSVTLASAPTKSGYNFTGWLVNGTLYKAGASVSVAANKSVTATAQWTAITYTHTIKYDSNGGSTVSNTVKTDTNSGSTSLTLASAPTKSGSPFVGWMVNGTLYNAGASVSVAANSSVTAKATWAETSVTGGFTDYKDTTVYATVGSSVDISYSGTAGTAMRLYLSDSACGLTLTNYDTSDDTDRNVSGIFLKTGTFTVSANHQGASYGTITFVVTTDVSGTYSHVVTYDSNGGSTVEPSVVWNTASGSSSVTLASGPSKSGYTFTGWKIGSTTYAAGKTVSVAFGTVTTATAQWSENTVSASASAIYGKSNASYTNQITASANNGGSVSYAVKSVTGGSASVSTSGLVTYTCPSVTATTTYKVTVTVTGTFSDGSTKSTNVTFDVIVDPILAFTNSVTSGSLIIKGTGA